MSSDAEKKIDAIVETFRRSCGESTAERAVRKTINYAVNQHEAVADGVEGAVNALDRFFDWALK